MSSAASQAGNAVTATNATGEASKEVVRRFWAANMSGDRDRIRELFAPDAVFWMAAAPPNWGKAGTLDDWFAVVDGSITVAAGEDKIEFGPLFAEGEHVSVQLQAQSRFVNGRLYQGHYHWYFRVRDGKIVQVREYFDTLHVVESLLGTSVLPEFELGGPHPDRGTNLVDGGRESLD